MTKPITQAAEAQRDDTWHAPCPHIFSKLQAKQDGFIRVFCFVLFWVYLLEWSGTIYKKASHEAIDFYSTERVNPLCMRGVYEFLLMEVACLLPVKLCALSSIAAPVTSASIYNEPQVQQGWTQ